MQERDQVGSHGQHEADEGPERDQQQDEPRGLCPSTGLGDSGTRRGFVAVRDGRLASTGLAPGHLHQGDGEGDEQCQKMQTTGSGARATTRLAERAPPPMPIIGARLLTAAACLGATVCTQVASALVAIAVATPCKIRAKRSTRTCPARRKSVIATSSSARAASTDLRGDREARVPAVISVSRRLSGYAA